MVGEALAILKCFKVSGLIYYDALRVLKCSCSTIDGKMINGIFSSSVCISDSLLIFVVGFIALSKAGGNIFWQKYISLY